HPHCGQVGEHLLLTVVRRAETAALGVVEPLHQSGCHMPAPLPNDDNGIWTAGGTHGRRNGIACTNLDESVLQRRGAMPSARLSRGREPFHPDAHTARQTADINGVRRPFFTRSIPAKSSLMGFRTGSP